MLNVYETINYDIRARINYFMHAKSMPQPLVATVT